MTRDVALEEQTQEPTFSTRVLFGRDEVRVCVEVCVQMCDSCSPPGCCSGGMRYMCVQRYACRCVCGQRYACRCMCVSTFSTRVLFGRDEVHVCVEVCVQVCDLCSPPGCCSGGMRCVCVRRYACRCMCVSTFSTRVLFGRDEVCVCQRCACRCVCVQMYC